MRSQLTSALAVLSSLTTVLGASRTEAPTGCITVGSGSSYTTIQSAVDSLLVNTTEAQCIFIEPGTYTEQVLVPERQAQLSMYGYTQDTGNYTENQVTITGNLSQLTTGGNNDGTATLRVKAENFKLYNVNVANTYGIGSQAVALSAYASSGYYACQFTGYQDTVLAQTGGQIYAKSLILGATDFIFGQYAPAWFEQCDIRVVSASLGYVTANGRRSADGTSYYVFNDCDVAAASGNVVADGAYYLGRPWGNYSRVAFQDTSMSSVINPAGWSIWSTGDERVAEADFAEYANTGAGAAGTRANFSHTMSDPIAITAILGDDYAEQGYYDATYM